MCIISDTSKWHTTRAPTYPTNRAASLRQSTVHPRDDASSAGPPIAASNSNKGRRRPQKPPDTKAPPKNKQHAGTQLSLLIVAFARSNPGYLEEWLPRATYIFPDFSKSINNVGGSHGNPETCVASSTRSQNEKGVLEVPCPCQNLGNLEFKALLNRATHLSVLRVMGLRPPRPHNVEKVLTWYQQAQNSTGRKGFVVSLHPNPKKSQPMLPPDSLHISLSIYIYIYISCHNHGRNWKNTWWQSVVMWSVSHSRASKSWKSWLMLPTAGLPNFGNPRHEVNIII
jgi:hypothetical protein